MAYNGKTEVQESPESKQQYENFSRCRHCFFDDSKLWGKHLSYIPIYIESRLVAGAAFCVSCNRLYGVNRIDNGFHDGDINPRQVNNMIRRLGYRRLMEGHYTTAEYVAAQSGLFPAKNNPEPYNERCEIV